MSKADRLDWNDLRYFLAAVRAHSLAGAARALGVKHTTVGRRLTELERELGGALFLRAPDGLKLTPLGEKLLPAAEQMERTTQTLHTLASSHLSVVRIAVPSGFVSQFAPFLAKFRKAHPNVTLEFLSGSRKTDLTKGDAELALRVGKPGDDSLIARKAGEIGWSLYASPQYLALKPYRANARDFSGHQLIGFDTRLSSTPPANWLEERVGSASFEIRHREVTDMISSAVSGLGIAMLPCAYADNDARLQRLTSDILVRTPISLVYRRDVALSANVRVVIDFMIEALRTAK